MKKLSSKIGTGRYLQIAAVTGHGIFPLDMLRYDRCYPKDSTDVDILHASMSERGSKFSIIVSRTVQYADEEWTVERWKSFGWQLQEISA